MNELTGYHFTQTSGYIVEVWLECDSNHLHNKDFHIEGIGIKPFLT